MRNLKKILIAICVIALLSAGFVVMAFAEESDVVSDKGNVEELSDYIADAESASDAQGKYDALSIVNSYLSTKDMAVGEMDDETKAVYDAALLRTYRAIVVGADMFFDSIPEDLTADGVDLNAAFDSFINANTMLTWFEIPETTAGFSDIKPKHDAVLERVATAFVNTLKDGSFGNTITNTAENKIQLNKVNSLITYCKPYGSADFITAIKARYDVCLAAHNAAVAEKLGALDSLNDIADYDLPVFFDEKWEEVELGYYLTQKAFSDATQNKWMLDLKGISNKVGIREDENGNRYYVHEYHEKKNPASSYIQHSLSDCNAENGLVFEFDIATFGEIPKGGINIETGGIGGLFPQPYIRIDGDGNIITLDTSNKAQILLEGALVKGGWIHIIIAFDPDDFVYNLYAEGQYLGTYNAGNASVPTFNHANAVFRLNGGASTQGEIAYDNIMIYGGSNYRSQDKLAKMSDEEKFVYFVNYAGDTSAPVLAQKSAYDKATELFPKYWAVVDPEAETPVYDYTDVVKQDIENGNAIGLKAAVDAYLNFEIDELIRNTKLDNLDTYVKNVEWLMNMERSPSSISLREALIGSIDAFVNENKDLIDYEADIYTSVPGEELPEDPANPDRPGTPNGKADFEEYEAILKTIIKEVEYDNNSIDFVKYMDRFLGATSLSSTERHYNNAKKLIDDGKLDMNIILNDEAEYRENFGDLLNAYEVYTNAHKKVDEITKTSNSKKIVTRLAQIIQYRTEEEWEANEELMKEYLDLVKDIILGRDAQGKPLYDESIEGVVESVRFFDNAYGYFYNKLQDEHDAYIGELLDLMATSDDYVVKLGIIARIDRYLETNEIDYEDDRFVAHLANLETVRSELVLREKDYAQVLRQNAVYFVNYVEKMRTATNYNEQVAYFEEAALIYFSLDSSVEGVANAREIYNEYREKLTLIKDSSIEFIASVEVYKNAETADDKYAALVDCYYYAQFVELTYEGVAEAMEAYKAAYDAHMGYANAVNSDITETGHAVGSFRTNCKVTPIIAIIVKKIFE